MVVIRPPPDGLPEDSARVSGSALFPVPVLVTGDASQAEALAARMRDTGAVIAIIEDLDGVPTTCPKHPPQLLGRNCSECGMGICAQCRLDAGGGRLCASCKAARAAIKKTRRVRQLFAMFLFSVFLFQVVEYNRDETAHLDINEGIDVGVFQFVQAEDANHPMIVALNDVGSPWALRRVQDWYQEEYARFTGSTVVPIRITTFGPWVETVTPPNLDDPDLNQLTAAWRAWRYADFWHRLAREHGAEPRTWDVRIYLVYGHDAGTLASDSRGSSTGRIAVSFVSLDDSNAAYAQETVAHELGHVLGAEDLYDPDTSLALLPYGLVEPNRKPLLPQRYAELMAVDRPLTATTEAEVRSLSQVRIGYHSAALMGWIDTQHAESRYSQEREVVFGPAELPLTPVVPVVPVVPMVPAATGEW